MRRALFIFALITGLVRCASTPDGEKDDVRIEIPPPQNDELRRIQEVRNKLGLTAPATELGYTEKQFNPCQLGLQPGSECRPQHITVLNFQLLCRDTEGTVSDVPVALQPIVANQVKWKIGTLEGDTRTDIAGFGQIAVVSDVSTHAQRLILRIGPQFVSFSVSEVNKIVLPKNFCRNDSV